MWRACMAFVLLVAVFIVCWPAQAYGDEEKLLQGFEKATAFQVKGGKITLLRAGEGVTEGKQALELSAGATLHVSIDGGDLKGMGWLKLDTLTVQPLVQPVELKFSAKGFSLTVTAYVQPGKDVLALPLSVIAEMARAPWPDKKIQMSLANRGGSALILDNLRLEAAAKPPKGSVLLDFGRKGQPIWPGFQGGGTGRGVVMWGGKRDTGGLNLGYPDPLSGDYFGPWSGGKIKDYFKIRAPSKPAVAWIWVTHYGRNRTQPVEYVMACGGKTLLRKRLSQRQMLSGQGLLEGIDGAWTPEWFDKKYAGHFYDVVQLSLPNGEARCDVGNCQLAAVVVGPASAKPQLAKYVAQVHKDISRYRRQFVVGYRSDTFIITQPTEAEKKAGVIVFSPPGDEAFAPEWKGGDKDRAKSIKVVAANGGYIIVPLAAAPIREAKFLSGRISLLKTNRGQTLVFGKLRPDVRFLQRVPQVKDGRVVFRPWILARRSGTLRPREVGHILLSVHIPPAALSGVYKGTLTLEFSVGRADLPVEIQVVNLGPAVPRPVVGTTAGASAAGLLFGLARTMPEAQRDTLTRSIRGFLFANTDIGAVTFSSPHVTSKLKISDGSFRRSLQALPRSETPAPGMLSLSSSWYGLRKKGVRAGTVRFQKQIGRVVSRTRQLASRSSLRDYYFYLGSVRDVDDVPLASDRARAVRVSGGRVAVRLSRDVLKELPAGKWKQSLGQFSAVLFESGRGLDNYISRFKKLAKDKKAFLYTYNTGRYYSGFYLATVGADGVYFSGVFNWLGRPYNGFCFSPNSLMIVRRDGKFAATLASRRLAQGVNDYMLLRRAENLLARAGKAKLPAEKLDALLVRIKSGALKSHVSDEQLEQWRVELVLAAGEIAAKLTGK